MSKAAPTARPVHPCVLSVWEGNSGAEYSTWAHITVDNDQLPNLVTAQGSSLHIYTLDETSGQLLLQHAFPDLAGTVCYLSCLKTPHGQPDSLLVGFAGHPRLIIATVTPKLLMATTLIDLTQALMERNMGSVTPLEQDLLASLEQKSPTLATLGVVLGGGVAVAVLTLQYSQHGWNASEPYLLSLASLSPDESHTTTTSAAATTNSPVLSHGLGEIQSITWLEGYREPTLVLLHTPGLQQVWSGRVAQGTLGSQVTAVSVTVAHRRSAKLWSAVVPADALSLHSLAMTGCWVMCVNSILWLNNAGRIDTLLAVNGWARSACPSGLINEVKGNPAPLPKLSIQLDGASLCGLQENLALVSLRRGQLYLLQHAPESNELSMIPLNHSVGEGVSSLLSLGFPKLPKGMLSSVLTGKDEKEQLLSMGIIFCGSRMGDSSLLGYTLENNVRLVEEASNEKKPKLEDDTVVKVEDGGIHESTSEYEALLQKEEDALYASTEEDGGATGEAWDAPNVIPPSEDEDELFSSGQQRKRERSQVKTLTVVRSLTLLDSLAALGPIGPGCEGPIAPPSFVEGEAEFTIGDTARIFSCGYGSSGGLAVLTAPGRDDGTILTEADCLNMQCLFSLPSLGLILMSAEKGVNVLRVKASSSVKTEGGDGETEELEISEVILQEWCSPPSGDNAFENSKVIMSEMTLLSAAELTYNHFVALVHGEEPGYAAVILKEEEGKLKCVAYNQLFDTLDSSIVSVSRMILQKAEEKVSFGCVWSSGNATVTTIGMNGIFNTNVIASTDKEDDPDDNDETAYYKSDRVTAIDVFVAPETKFMTATGSSSAPMDTSTEAISSTENGNDQDLDDEDAELYGSIVGGSGNSPSPTDRPEVTTPNNGSASDDETHFVAVCRRSGLLQIFKLSDFSTTLHSPTPYWEAHGCGLGVSVLDENPKGRLHPRMHKVHTAELRFFFSGSFSKTAQAQAQKFCIMMETNLGDTQLYEMNGQEFVRVPMRLCGRPSQEQTRHQAKLRRKGIISTVEETSFRFNRLHPFNGISGQSGLFAATTRPMWIVSERGSLTALWHRSRHCAPAGGKTRSVTGFCVGLTTGKDLSNQNFVTMHERIGRVGSQRVTVFSGISRVMSSTSNGFLPGGGVCVEKIPLGVTVHYIELVNDTSVSSGTHPLYAVLISREIEMDQSQINDDGLTDEERQIIEEEKEAALIKRQVEADLGGFDLEQEWVEEIEREDCIEIDMSIGGAPPIQKRAYALWLVDASDKWNVVDSFQLEEFEHGMTMKVMSLTEVNEEPGSANSSAIGGEDHKDSLFVTVGTGIVDKDGEDVSSKGRTLLFEVKRQSSSVELSLLYEKEILHGPVTTLSCLSCDGRNRLVIGAGSDVNVEQWGNGKLTQVGFFRANMHILDITLFKTFFLLSDAYDSLYFLVWRESDKSLTLLAKDYEPIPVFAAGIMSRGGAMSLVCHDDRKNLQFFQYAPRDAAARGGNKLVCRSDVHLGAQTVSLQSYYCKSSLIVNSATPTSTLEALKQQDRFFGKADDDQRLGIHFGSSDGTFMTVIPLSEPAYWRLTALQSVLANALESDGALSRRAWRLYRRTPRRGGCKSNDRKKGVIDGDLVIQFCDLSLSDQEDLASAIGSTVELILDNLVELRCSSMVI